MSHNQARHGHPLSPTGRVVLSAASIVLVLVFAVALFLRPDPRGYGTHQQLGLRGCTMRVMFGIPCPACGMTTSFSHFVRGQLGQAADANIAGLMLAAIAALSIPWCWMSAYAGRLVLVERPALTAAAILLVVATAAFFQWIGWMFFA